MPGTRNLQDLRFDDVHVGDTFALGEYEMDRSEVIAFASKYDPQSYHTDETATIDHPIFERMSASGWHTVMVTQLMLTAFWRKTKVQGLAGGQVDVIQWHTPVYPGDRLTGELTIPKIRRSETRPERGIITMDVTLINQAGAKVLSLVIVGIFSAE